MTDARAHDATMRNGSQTSLAGLTGQQVRMALAPLATVTSLVMEALGWHRGTPSAWYGPVRDALDPDDVMLLGPVLGNRDPALVPDCLIPRSETFTPSFEGQLDQMVTLSREELDVELASQSYRATAWASVALDPLRWTAGYAAALRRAWVPVRPLWARAAGLLEGEVSRVGTALARGSFAVLVDDLYPKGYVHDDRWFIACRDQPVAIDVGMVVTPILGGRDATFLSLHGGTVSCLAYPLPRARRLLNGDTRGHSDDQLIALLGEPRAEILRRLDRAAIAGSLATSMLFVPSAISHHVLALERAGLARREQRGRNVFVHRTARGTELLNLYDR